MNKYISAIAVGIILMMVVSTSTASELKRTTISIPAGEIETSLSGSKGVCAFGPVSTPWASHVDINYLAGDRAVMLLDPDDCNDSPNFPFEIKSLSFSLFDDDAYMDATWPCTLDVAVYDLAPSLDICDGPGDELCRFSIICDSAIFAHIPDISIPGTVTFPEPCCVNQPFFIGLEYTGQGGPYPSIVYNDYNPASCVLWDYRGASPGWTEWYSAWDPEDPSFPGHPIWTINGDTDSPFCGTNSIWWLEPSGDYMPDFDMNQDTWSEYAAPTAAANCMYWFDKHFADWGLIPDAMTVPTLIDSLAKLMDTNVDPPSGTYIDNIKVGIDILLEEHELEDNMIVDVIDQPSYDTCRTLLLNNDNVVLKFGYWQVTAVDDDTPSDCITIHWERVGEHYVSMAGVSPVGTRLGLSDPAKDAAETSPSPPNRVLGGNHDHPTGHNDGISVSHDVYYNDVLGISPGGNWELYNYWYITKYGRPSVPEFPSNTKGNTKEETTVWCDVQPSWIFPTSVVTVVEGAVVIASTRNPVPGIVYHSADEYFPSKGDPTGYAWQELWPNFDEDWDIAVWIDEGDNRLSSGDTVMFEHITNGRRIYDFVEWVGPTLITTLNNSPDDSVYFEIIGPNPMVDDIYDPRGMYLHEIRPNKGNLWQFWSWFDNGNGYLDTDDEFMAFPIGGVDFENFTVEIIETDIIATPLPTPSDQYDHSGDGYVPSDGDPTGTSWDELYPNYPDGWLLTEWHDNTDGKLSYGDTVKFVHETIQDSIIWKAVDEVTVTAELSSGITTHYMEYMCGNPDIEIIEDLVGTYWLSIRPSANFKTRWICNDWVDDGNSYLDDGDQLTLEAIDGALEGTVTDFTVLGLRTDLISTWVYPDPSEPIQGDINLRNTDDFRPGDGDPTGSVWSELWPEFDEAWTLTSWFDEGDGSLGVDDYIDCVNDVGQQWKKFKVVWIGPTLTANDITGTVYLDYIGTDRADVGDISNPVGAYWLEKYPDYSVIYIAIDWSDENTDSKVGLGDQISLRNVETGQDRVVDILGVDTDLSLAEISVNPTNPLSEGSSVMHNLDVPQYYPPDGDPSGSRWQELWPTGLYTWTLGNWFDNGDTKLSAGDYVDLQNDVADTMQICLVEWVGPTIAIIGGDGPHHLEYCGYDNPDINSSVTPLDNPVGTYWQEATAENVIIYYCVGWINNGNPEVDFGDDITLQNMNSGTADVYDIITVKTDVIFSIVTEPEPRYPGINLHNDDGWKPPAGSPVGTDWYELYPVFDNLWQLTDWFDNGDGKLSVNDRLQFNSLTETDYFSIWLGPTLKASLDQVESYYEYAADDNPDNDDITDPIGTIWYEVRPDYNHIHICVAWLDNSNGIVDNGDYLTLQNISTGVAEELFVEAIDTDMLVTDQLCDCQPGECDGSPPLDILDIVHMIDYKFKECPPGAGLGSCPPPTPYLTCSGDADCNCIVDILDIVLMIDYKFKECPPGAGLGSCPPPCSCEDWVTECGWPIH
jgi:hypothetical protein